MRIVITGGAGFVGSHLADAFLARGDSVVCVDDLSTLTTPGSPSLKPIVTTEEGLARTMVFFRSRLDEVIAARSAVAGGQAGGILSEIDGDLPTPRETIDLLNPLAGTSV